MSNTRGWGIEEEKLEYEFDQLIASGAMREFEAQERLPGYEYPGIEPAVWNEMREQEEQAAAQEDGR